MPPIVEKNELLPNPPLVSVVVCTRNRGDNVLLTARAVLASDYPDFELLILDQSDDDSTRNALIPLCEQDNRVRHFQLELPGKPGALNRACVEARGKYLALTDDDCEPEAHWLRVLVEAFEADPAVGCVFGDVAAAPHDKETGYIPDNPIAAEHTIYHLREYLKMPRMVDFGIGANMAARADALAKVGGWDPCIGPGAKFRNGDDHDLAVRMLLAGCAIHFTPKAKTLHYGFRYWNESARDVEHTAFGFGTTFIKFLRCGKLYYGSLRMLGYFLFQIVWRGIHFKRPLGIAFPRGWVRGLIAGAKHPVDRRTLCFRKADEDESRKYGQEFAQIVLRTQQAELVETSARQSEPNAPTRPRSEADR